MSFDNQVVIVTGASRGIGRAIATAFGERGAKVACCATRKENAEATAASIAHGAAFGVNVGDSESVAKTYAEIVEMFGAPDVLVNNAGITRDGLLMRMKDEEWDEVLQVNLKGAYLWSKAVCRDMMKKRYGRIVNIASIVGVSGAAGQANYAASKAGLIGMTKSLAKELGPRGITVNAICPGFIETDMTAELSEEMKKNVLDKAPISRLGKPEDIAPAVCFLASAEAGYITGQSLVVDGGLIL